MNAFGPPILPVRSDVERPLWSVMIPAYNSERYLGDTLRSVLAQDFGVGQMQIEVVDDCSTGSAVEQVVRRVGGGRVEFFRQPVNVGVTANFNECLRRARGHLVHVLHSDDFVLDGFYSALGPALMREEVGAAFCRFYYLDQEAGTRRAARLERDTPGILEKWLELISVSCRIECPAVAVPRRVYERLGGFNQELVHAADWEMWRRIAAHYGVWYEPEVRACYRLHSESDTNALSLTARDIQDVRKSIAIVRRYLPDDCRAAVTSAARERWAERAMMNGSQFLYRGRPLVALRQFWQGFLCRPSLAYVAVAIVVGLRCWVVRFRERWAKM